MLALWKRFLFCALQIFYIFLTTLVPIVVNIGMEIGIALFCADVPYGVKFWFVANALFVVHCVSEVLFDIVVTWSVIMMCFGIAFDKISKRWLLESKSKLINREIDVLNRDQTELYANWELFHSDSASHEMLLIFHTKKDEIAASRRRLELNAAIILSPTVSPFASCDYWQSIACASYSWMKFYPVVICDRDKIDDPFWPRHASVVYSVQVRGSKIVVYQVSILNGGRKIMHIFNRAISWNDNVQCFESAGVIFVFVSNLSEQLFVYDTRYRWSSRYTLRYQASGTSLALISCLGRIDVDPTSPLRRWRIRFIEAFGVRGEIVVGNNNQDRPWRASLRHNELDLLVNLGIVIGIKEHDEIDFGIYYTRPRFRFVRTSRGTFGLYAESEHSADGPAMLWDEAQGYVYCANFQDLLKLDRHFAAYFYTPTPTGIGNLHGDSLRPTMLSDRECVECQGNGRIDRTDFVPSTLKFSGAQALFRSSVDVRRRMNANQFWMATGIRRMDAHFGNVQV